MVNPVSDGSKPATEWIRVVSKLSSKLMEGRMVGIRFANIVFPAPGYGKPKAQVKSTAASRSELALAWAYCSKVANSGSVGIRERTPR